MQMVPRHFGDSPEPPGIDNDGYDGGGERRSNDDDDVGGGGTNSTRSLRSEPPQSAMEERQALAVDSVGAVPAPPESEETSQQPRQRDARTATGLPRYY